MNRQEFLAALIEAYERGLADGHEQSSRERQRQDGWHRLKERCLEKFKEPAS
jgi:hypothetical protein